MAANENKDIIRRYLQEALEAVRQGDLNATNEFLANGQIGEARSELDQLGMLQQLGVIPAPGQA